MHAEAAAAPQHTATARPGRGRRGRRARRRALDAASGLALAAALALAGCVAYRSAGPAAVALEPRPEKKTISVLVRTSASYEGDKRMLADYLISQWKTAILRGYEETGLFADVKPGTGRSSDLQATVRIENTLYASRGVSFLSAVSFFVVPLRHLDAFAVSTTLTDRSGAVLAELRSEATVTTFYQVAFAPGMLFFSRDAVMASTLRALARDTAAQARSKGLL